jgi:hypothetical protein
MPTKAPTPCPKCGSLGKCEHRTRASAHERGYDNDHRRRTAAAIKAEPWCHSVDCPYDDVGSTSNPLTGAHPLPLRDFNGNKDAWGRQPRVPQCRRCNVGKRPIR